LHNDLQYSIQYNNRIRWVILRMSEKKLHNVIINEIKSVDGYPGLKILDLSCGDARILSELAGSGALEQGAELTGTRFREEDYIIEGEAVHPGITIINNVDLSKPLPFENESFDVVYMKEVLEHLPNHLHIIDEAGRILKKGGTFIASTPNIHRLHSRFLFFLTGAHKLKRRRIGWELSRDEVYAYHYNPVDFPIIHSLLHYAGLTITHLPATTIKFKHLWLLAFYPLIYLCSLLEYRKGAPRASHSGESEHQLRKLMTGRSILLSEQLVISARKFLL
jgi:SAM-dependent methyltransferase